MQSAHLPKGSVGERRGALGRSKGVRGSTGGARASNEGAGGASRKHVEETGLSEGAKRRHLSQRLVTCWPGFEEVINIYIYIYMFPSPCT